MYTPAFKLKLGALDFNTEELKIRVQYIEVETAVDDMAAFKIELDNTENFFSGEQKIKEGDRCTIELGYVETSTTKVFEGQITNVSTLGQSRKRSVFVVSGFDDFQALSRGRKRRSWEKIRDDELVGILASEGGLGSNAENPGIVHPYVVQKNVTNLEFLYERAARLGFEVLCENKTVIFRKPQKPADGAKLSWDGERRKDGWTVIYKCNLNASTKGLVDKVTVRGYDPKEKKKIVGTSSDTRRGTMKGQKFGYARATDNNPGLSMQISDKPVTSVAEAELLAQAELEKRGDSFIVGNGKCEGDPKIIAGRYTLIEDFGTELDGQYFIQSAKHVMRFSAGPAYGYATTFEVKRTAR